MSQDKTKQIVGIPMWWEGDPRVQPYMGDVAKAIERHIPGGCTDIYNRAYEAVYNALCDHATKTKKMGEL